MDKFSQLIIEAYRNQNFRFAEELAPVDPESEIVAPSALDYPGLFLRMQSLEDDMKTKILEYLTRAQTKLKMDYNIDSELPIKFDSGIFLEAQFKKVCEFCRAQGKVFIFKKSQEP